MATTTAPFDAASVEIRVSPRFAFAAVYVLIGALAIGIAVPLAFMTSDAGLFEECYSSCETAMTLAGK